MFSTPPLTPPRSSPSPVESTKSNTSTKRKREPQPLSRPSSEAMDRDSSDSASSALGAIKHAKILDGYPHIGKTEMQEVEEEEAFFYYTSDDYNNEPNSSPEYPITSTFSTHIDSESWFGIGIQHETIIEDHYLSEAINLCVMCDKPAAQTCMWCWEESEIGWCSSSHVNEFYGIHSPKSPLCLQFASEYHHSQRLEPDSRRLVYFPLNQSGPICC